MEDRNAAQFSLVLGVLLLFWSSAFAAIRVGLEGYSPGQLALLRLLTASAALGFVAVVRRTRLPGKTSRSFSSSAGWGSRGTTSRSTRGDDGERRRS